MSATLVNYPVLKVIEINDREWWFGESLEQVKEAYGKEYPGEPELLEDARVLSDEELARFEYSEEGADGKMARRSFAEQLEILKAEGNSFPAMFAVAD